MRFLYVFSMMFLSIFGLVVLLKVLYNAFFDGCTRKFEVYVKDCENIDEFIENARKSAFIERVTVITEKSGTDLKTLSEKYDDVRFVSETER
ncbi:MAG: hypothetical protein MR364_09425 [Oscillospiraceae bacterium]|nr:hypothetical protein [Oscillospiraceae bacterium]